MMGIFDPIINALSKPGPVTDHSTHTTTQLPPHPMTGAVHTNGAKSADDNFEALRRAKGGPKPY